MRRLLLLAALPVVAAGCGSKQAEIAPAEDFEIKADSAYVLGEQEEAIEGYQRALQEGSSTTKLHNNLGNALFKEQRYNAAEQSYLQALGLDHEYLFSLNNLALTKYHNGEIDEAYAIISEAKRSFPTISFFRTTEGYFLYQEGKTEEALESFREAVRINPDSPAALNNIGVLAMENEEIGEAPVPYMKRAIDKDPTNKLFHDSLGWYYFNKGMFAEATIEIGKAFAYDPQNIDVRVHYASVLEWIGKDQEALEQWEMILGLSEDREVRKMALEHVWEIRGRNTAGGGAG